MSAVTEYVEPPALELKPTCDICDEYVDKALVVAPSQWKSYGGKGSYCGYAVTAQCINDDNTWIKDIVESTIGTGKVLIVDANNSTNGSIIGSKIAKIAVEHKWEGIVIYGCVRTVNELSKLDIGIHATGNVPNKSIVPQQRRTGAAGEIITITNIPIATGDMIYADADGVVVVKA